MLTADEVRELAYKLLITCAPRARHGGQSWKFVLAARKTISEVLVADKGAV